MFSHTVTHSPIHTLHTRTHSLRLSPTPTLTARPHPCRGPHCFSAGARSRVKEPSNQQAWRLEGAVHENDFGRKTRFRRTCSWSWRARLAPRRCRRAPPARRPPSPRRAQVLSWSRSAARGPGPGLWQVFERPPATQGPRGQGSGHFPTCVFSAASEVLISVSRRPHPYPPRPTPPRAKSKGAQLRRNGCLQR